MLTASARKNIIVLEVRQMEKKRRELTLEEFTALLEREMQLYGPAPEGPMDYPEAKKTSEQEGTNQDQTDEN